MHGSRSKYQINLTSNSSAVVMSKSQYFNDFQENMDFQAQFFLST